MLYFILLFFSLSFASEGVHWSYDGPTGPDNWGHLQTENGLCDAGQSQSPIDLIAASGGARPEIEFSFRPIRLKVANNGHTIQVSTPNAGTLRIGKEYFDLLQFHFHTPSEHHVHGIKYPMELHLVHKQPETGQLAVVGVMLEEDSAPNEFLEEIWQHLPLSAGPIVDLRNSVINPTNLIPKNKKFFRYQGSLTTPPCSEGVIWNVFLHPIKISKEQVTAFQKLFPMNARPVQGLNERPILSN